MNKNKMLEKAKEIVQETKTKIQNTQNSVQGKLKKMHLPTFKKVNKVGTEEVIIELETEDKKPIIFSAIKTNNSNIRTKPKTKVLDDAKEVVQVPEPKESKKRWTWSMFQKSKKEGEKDE